MLFMYQGNIVRLFVFDKIDKYFYINFKMWQKQSEKSHHNIISYLTSKLSTIGKFFIFERPNSVLHEI